MKVKYRPEKVDEKETLVKHWRDVDLINVDIFCYYNPKMQDLDEHYYTEILEDDGKTLIIYPYYDREEDQEPQEEIENPAMLYYICYLIEETENGQDFSRINKIGVKSKESILWIPEKEWKVF